MLTDGMRLTAGVLQIRCNLRQYLEARELHCLHYCGTANISLKLTSCYSVTLDVIKYRCVTRVLALALVLHDLYCLNSSLVNS